jgi:hypothetical protein
MAGERHADGKPVDFWFSGIHILLVVAIVTVAEVGVQAGLKSRAD